MMVIVCIAKNTIDIVFVFDQLQCAGVVWAWAVGPRASNCKTRRCNVLRPLPISISFFQPLPKTNGQGLPAALESRGQHIRRRQSRSNLVSDRAG